MSKSETQACDIRYEWGVREDAGLQGKPVGVFAVPTTSTRVFKVYRNGVLVPKVPPVVIITVTGTSILFRPVTPTTPKMKPHAVGDLDSYQPYTTGYAHIPGGLATWTPSTTTTVTFSKEVQTVTSSGSYLSFKTGGGLPKVFTAGVEGEFSWDFATATTLSTEWSLTLHGIDAKRPGDVTLFDAHLMLFMPAKNAYWIPREATGPTDAAWFLTAEVENIRRLP